jgi:tetratricopeptide (TPR) repeat protein
MSDDVRSLKSLAAQRIREGRMGEAARLFERIVELEPEAPNNWFNLGYTRRMSRDYAGALEAYAQALDRGVSSPEDAHINRAVILSEYLHDVPGAADELRRAVMANPWALKAWLNLGNLHEDLGDTAAAREAYAKALGIDPRSGRATARLAAIDRFENGTKAALPSLREAASRAWPTAQDGAEVRFALGNALDSAGEYAEAFQAIAEANRLAASARLPNARYDPVAQERLVDELIALPPLPAADPLPLEQTPIFICGMFRSGSTLVEQLLARHPEIAAGGELEFIPGLIHEELRPYPQSLTRFSAKRLTELRDKYLDQLHRLFPGAGRVTDKRPDNFQHIAFIKSLFPQARIVHTRRHPLDNILSAYFLYFGDDVRYSEALEDITHYYSQYRRLMDHWSGRFGADIHDVDYDRLVADPRAELEPLLAFLDLEWDEACLQHQPAEVVRTASNWQVRQPLHGRSTGRWRNYAQALEPIRKQLADAGLLEEAE